MFGVTETSLAASAKRSLRVGQGDFELLVLRPKLAVLLGQAELVVDTSSLLRGQFLPQLLDMRHNRSSVGPAAPFLSSSICFLREAISESCRATVTSEFSRAVWMLPMSPIWRLGIS